MTIGAFSREDFVIIGALGLLGGVLVAIVVERNWPRPKPALAGLHCDHTISADAVATLRSRGYDITHTPFPRAPEQDLAHARAANRLLVTSARYFRSPRKEDTPDVRFVFPSSTGAELDMWLAPYRPR